MDAVAVKEIVESYGKQLISLEKMQNRLISLSGRSIEQEEAITQRISEIERKIEIVDFSIEMNELTNREQAMVIWRSEGKTLEGIGAGFGVSRERSRQILEGAYEKMAVVSRITKRRRR